MKLNVSRRVFAAVLVGVLLVCSLSSCVIPQKISKQKVEKFLVDTQDAFASKLMEDNPMIDANFGKSLTSGSYQPTEHVKNNGRIFDVVDSFYGIIGSEPTTIQVSYSYNGKTCVVLFTLIADKASPYTFDVTDLSLLP